MPILQKWEKNCPVGHAIFIYDCRDCYRKKLINWKKKYLI